MKFEALIRRHIRRTLEDNVDVDARINGAIAANVGENEGVATAVAVDRDDQQQTTEAARASTSERRRG